MGKKISIIVPIYNVSRYLNKCIDSIINQTYKNTEIILVNDGSTDNSGEICDYYKSIDNRIIVIHKNNGGLSSARNAGLNIVSGDYIGFVDSDDYIALTMYEKMISFLINENCDIVECAVNLCTGNDIKEYNKKNNLTMSGKDALKMHLDLNKKELMPRTAVWSKLFKSNFWSNKRFPEGEVHEDYLLTSQNLYEAKKVGLLREGLYYHLISNMNSIVNSKFGVKDLYKEKQLIYRIEYLKKKQEPELIKYAIASYYSVLTSIIWKCDQNGLNEVCGFIKKAQKNFFEIMFSMLPFKKKIEYILICLTPKLYLKLRRLCNSKVL